MKTEESIWWNSLDMTDNYLIKLYSGMFGTAEQRVRQLFIVRNNLNFALRLSPLGAKKEK
jgi:hypothetical protein